MERKFCPHCYVPLVLDYWDVVEEQEDGSFILDALDAWVGESVAIMNDVISRIAKKSPITKQIIGLM